MNGAIRPQSYFYHETDEKFASSLLKNNFGLGNDANQQIVDKTHRSFLDKAEKVDQEFNAYRSNKDIALAAEVPVS